jgi:cell division protein FtsW
MKTATTVLVFCVGSLLALGMVMLYSASSGTGYLMRQLMGMGLGIIACGVVATLDYNYLKRYAWWFLGAAVLLLIVVLIPGIGVKAGGARRWLNIGGQSFQPSELAKVALIVFIAYYTDRNQRKMGEFMRGLVIPGFIVGCVLGLIFIEPDRGTTILLAAVSASLLLLAGVRLLYLVPGLVVGVVGLGISFWHDPMRMRRILSWMNLEETKEGTGYQAYQAMLALGSGGLTGKGLGDGRQKLGFVPEDHTDFIFSILGEELGLVATLAVLLTFFILVVCGVYIAFNSRDTFGFMFGSGLSLLIGLQAFINIGVVTSALPNKGLALPFISYGGSNLLIMLTCVGLLLSIARHSSETAMQEEDFEAEELSTTQPG